jgi:hypothetical protein
MQEMMVTAPEAAEDVADEGIREADQPFGQAADVHDISAQDEERDAQHREVGHAGVQRLRDKGRRRDRFDRQQREDAQHQTRADRDAGKQRDRDHEHHQGGAAHSRPPSPFPFF